MALETLSTETRTARPSGTWIEVSLDKISRNLERIRQKASPFTGVMAVVKANAYGHGAAQVGRALEEAGADLLARRHHGVVFARVMHRRGFLAPAHQFVGFAGHGGDHHRHIVTGLVFALHMARDVADAVDIGDRRSAEFQHET